MSDNGRSPVQTPARPQSGWLGLSLTAWVQIAVVTVLMVATFRTNLWRLWQKTNPISGEANWGHAICVPIFGLYYLWLNREELLKRPVAPLRIFAFTRGRVLSAIAILLMGGAAWFVAEKLLPETMVQTVLLAGAMGLMVWGGLVLLLNWGVGTMLFGLGVFLYGIHPGKNDWVKDVGMVITLFGVVLQLCGWAIMRIAWFPVVFLICALPWPPLAYSKVATPLQNLAANAAVVTLNLTGVEAQQIGTKICIGGTPGVPLRTLNVAEACAGMRSLMTFISVGAALAFLSSRPLWQKLVIVASAVPIAILCNVIRVSGQGLLDHYVSHEMSESFAHQFVGLIMLIPAFFLLLLVGWLLDKIFVEETSARKRDDGVIIRRAAATGGAVLSPRRNLSGRVGGTAQTGENP